jgi:hypothetical protein
MGAPEGVSVVLAHFHQRQGDVMAQQGQHEKEGAAALQQGMGSTVA